MTQHISHTRATEALKHSARASPSPCISEMLPAFLEHLRVEERRAVGTLSRYESHIRRLLTAVGDRPVGEITSAQIAYFKRHLMDAGLSAPTMAAVLSCLRTFLKYLREVRGLPVYDPDRIHRPQIPKYGSS